VEGNKKAIICSWIWEEIGSFEANSEEIIINFDGGITTFSLGTK
jgi:hypothetical protein